MPNSTTRAPDPKHLFSSNSNPNLRGIKSNSTSQLPIIAPTSAGPSSQQVHDRSRSDTADFNTLPRTPTPLSNGARTPSTGSLHHPDLTNEVATLSTKLINAINHQTNLDDSLQNTRHELEAARERIAQLEAAALEHENLVQTGALVRREESDRIEQILKTEATDERSKRISAEKERKKMELELERLTSELFEEANSMVADARRGKQEAEQQKEQYQAQLRDAEVLLTSHQEQLRELKDVMQQLQSEERVDDSTQQPSAPSTPITAQHRRSVGYTGPSNLQQQPQGSSSHPVYPDHPLAFSNLISPVLRSDIQAYDEFVQLLKMGGSASPPSRVGSGNFAGLNVMGLGSLSNPMQSKIEKQQFANKNSNSSLSSSSPTPQNMPGSFNSTSSTDASSPSTATTLKEAKYYKRAVTEDIEPTLRLDTAPGLSWLARRGVISSMAAGNLAVEPFPPGQFSAYAAAYPCGLCGEAREGDTYTRRHRFRTSDSDEAQRHPVCDFCVGRLRATGDFVNFLRMVRSGYWRGESVEEARLAWEECLRLRERMFWSRVGGGVIPTSSYDSPTTPRKMRHHADRSVSSANLDGPLVEEPGESADNDALEIKPSTQATVPATLAADPAEDSGTAEPTTPLEKQKSHQSPTRLGRPQSAGVLSARESDAAARSKSGSVEALRNRFEAASQSRESSETRRSGSRPRTKSRTPSPQKQF